MEKVRKALAVGLCSLVLASCNTNKKTLIVNKNPEIIQTSQTTQIEKISYKLEELCDTEIYNKNIRLHVYIEPSDVLWDYHKYKEEIFSYVKNFFKEQNINCDIVYFKKQFTKFTKPNEFGVEILISIEDVVDRYFQLVPEKNKEKKKEERNLILNQREYAATKVGIALISGWEEFRDYLKNREMAIEEVEKQFSEKYKEMLVGEYIFRQNAALICHGLLHCMGSPHPLTQNSYFIKTSELDEIPNIMSYRLPKFEKDCVLGYKLDYLQKKLIHSFIAGNNAYRAFLASQRDLDIFIENLKRAN